MRILPIHDFLSKFALALLIIFFQFNSVVLAEKLVPKVSTDSLRFALKAEKSKTFLKKFIQYGEWGYGPLYSFDEDGRAFISFGVEMFTDWKWNLPGKNESIHFKQEMNYIIGPLDEIILELLNEVKGFDHFKKVPANFQWPEKGKKGVYRVGFSTGLREDLYPEQKIFNRIRKLNPDAFMLIGDTVYNDLPSGFFDFTRIQLDIKYKNQLQVRRLRDFYSHTPFYVVWDDHDFWSNDVDRDAVSPENRQWSRDLFTAIFPNPAYGENGEGIYFKWSLGDIDFFMLDTRWFRRKSQQQMLGKVQNEWLRKSLQSSQATFKVIVSSVQWHEKGGKDSWGGYQSERNTLFEFIFKNKIEGILLLSGDVHLGAAYRLTPALNITGYSLIEFTSSGLAVKPRSKSPFQTKEIEQLLNLKGKHNFGMVEFNTAAEKPYVDLKLYTKEDIVQWKNGQSYFRVYAHELQNNP